MENRLEFAGKVGTKWIGTGELDLLLSTIFWDGRYNQLCFVVLSSYQQLIKAACKANFDYQNVWAMHIDEKKNGIKIVEYTTRLLKGLVIHCLTLDPNISKPGIMFLQRLILFPINEGNAHWSATFVFNASFINEDVHGDHDLNKNALRPCFFGIVVSVQQDTREIP